jgi:putative membrane protein
LLSKNLAKLRARTLQRHPLLDSEYGPLSVGRKFQLPEQISLQEIAGDFHGLGKAATTRCLIEVASRRSSPIGSPIFFELIVPLRSLKLSDKMIKNFGDHSANERTFLAWVRTAIAVMAFGFLVEKFDLFLEFAAPSLAGRTLSLPGQKFGNIAGLSLIVLGTAMVGIAAARFVRIAKNIDREDMRTGTGSRIDIALAGLLVLLGCALFLYLSHALVTNL